MATYPPIAAGQRITTSVLSSLTYDYVFKTSNQTVANSVVLANDSELAFPVAANGTYEFDLYLRFGALNVAGVKTQLIVPGGVTFNRTCAGPGTANATQVDSNTTEMKWAQVGNTTSALYSDPRNSTTLPTFVWENGSFTTSGTAGNAQLQWAQVVANATGTVAQSGSYFRFRRIG